LNNMTTHSVFKILQMCRKGKIIFELFRVL